MENEPLISVIVSLYNYKKYISDCIKSVKNQDYNNYELIVVDDCSTDSSYERAKKFENNKIKVIKLNKNYGYSKAKNEGIILSKGEYITTIDADDMLTKDSLSSRLKTMLKHKVEFIYANAIKIEGKISLKECYNIKDPKIDYSLSLYDIHAQSVMVHRSVYKKYGLYDENLRSRADREMWWRLFGKSSSDVQKVSNYYLNKPVAYYRVHRYSMWRKRKRKPELDKMIREQSEEAYKKRKKEGITKENTIFLEK